MTAETLNLHRIDGASIEGNHARMVQCAHEQRPLQIDVAVPDDEPWTFGDRLLATLIGAVVLIIVVTVLFNIKPL